MTQDEIIRMAREAGFIPNGQAERAWLERFAALVAAHEREKLEDAYPAYIPYTDEELEEAKASLLKAKSLDERFAFIWETIYDHGNGKHLGALSRAQREVAWFYLQQIQDVCKAIEAAVLAEREACAKVCDERAKGWFEVRNARTIDEGCMHSAAKGEALALAAAIRARNTQLNQ